MFSFNFLLPIAAVILGGILFRLEFQKEIWVAKGKKASVISQAKFAALLLYIIYTIIVAAVVMKTDGKYLKLI
jgi:hypothetical protein